MQHVPQCKRRDNILDFSGPAMGVMTAAMMSAVLWLSALVLLGF